MSAWVIVRTPGGIHVYEIGPVQDDLERRLPEIRADLGVPDDHDPSDPTWDVQVTYGEPHGQLLAAAVVVHRLED